MNGIMVVIRTRSLKGSLKFVSNLNEGPRLIDVASPANPFHLEFYSI